MNGARVATALLVALCAGCSHGDDASDPTRFTHFERKEAARFPLDPWMQLPVTARDLRRVENRTTKQSVAVFSYDRADRLTVPPTCSPAAEVPAPAFRVSWWPKDIPPRGGALARYAFYTCDSGRTFLALSVGGNTVYHWRP